MSGQHDQATIESLLQVARYHQQHERFYAMEGLEVAARLRREANALKALADRWNDATSAAASPASDDPRFHAAGCADLNAQAAVASAGILFMEGENEPEEMTALKRRLTGFADQHVELGAWLDDMMDRAWSREAELLRPPTVTAAYRRHMVITRTALTAGKLAIAGRLARAAHTALTAQDFRPAAIRADRAAAAEIVRTAAWLLDAASAVLAEQAATIGYSDVDWTAYIDELESLGTSAGSATSTGTAPGGTDSADSADAGSASGGSDGVRRPQRRNAAKGDQAG